MSFSLGTCGGPSKSTPENRLLERSRMRRKRSDRGRRQQCSRFTRSDWHFRTLLRIGLVLCSSFPATAQISPGPLAKAHQGLNGARTAFNVTRLPSRRHPSNVWTAIGKSRRDATEQRSSCNVPAIGLARRILCEVPLRSQRRRLPDGPLESDSAGIRSLLDGLCARRQTCGRELPRLPHRNTSLRRNARCSANKDLNRTWMGLRQLRHVP